MSSQIIDLQQYNAHFVTSVLNELSQMKQSSDGRYIIETALGKWLENSVDFDEIHILRSFTQNMSSMKIGDYCNQQGIGIKQPERLVKKYVGITPKQLQQIRRFQTVSNQLIYNSSITTLADLAYSHDYFDQTHFIKNFKEYTDVTPSTFLADHNSVKEKIKSLQ